MEESNFGQFLKSLRERQRMSLRDAEKESGVSNAYITQIEHGGRAAPSPEILRKLAKAYRVTVRELFMRAGYLDEPEVTATRRRTHRSCLPIWCCPIRITNSVLGSGAKRW